MVNGTSFLLSTRNGKMKNDFSEGCGIRKALAHTNEMVLGCMNKCIA